MVKGFNSDSFQSFEIRDDKKDCEGEIGFTVAKWTEIQLQTNDNVSPNLSVLNSPHYVTDNVFVLSQKVSIALMWPEKKSVLSIF